MFANTITLTINASDYILNRINQDNFGSEYQYSGTDSSIVMKIRHSTDSPDSDGITMKRHNVFIERVVYPTPTSALEKATATMTIRHGAFVDPAEGANLQAALNAWVATGTVLADLGQGVN